MKNTVTVTWTVVAGWFDYLRLLTESNVAKLVASDTGTYCSWG